MARKKRKKERMNNWVCYGNVMSDWQRQEACAWGLHWVGLGWKLQKLAW